MMIEVFAGMLEGKPVFRREHPFLVFGGQPKSDLKLTDYVKCDDGRMRHVPRTGRRMQRRVEVSQRTGLPRPFNTVRVAEGTSRQVRRAIKRRQAQFQLQGA